MTKRIPYFVLPWTFFDVDVSLFHSRSFLCYIFFWGGGFTEFGSCGSSSLFVSSSFLCIEKKNSTFFHQLHADDVEDVEGYRVFLFVRHWQEGP